MVLEHKKIILGISGGVAAYKTPYILRELKALGAELRVVMTASAKQFVTPTTLQALCGHPIHDDLWDPEQEAAMGHIDLARWADGILIAPATAQTLARLAHGIADDLLSTLCLATQAPVFLAPAMNRVMWENPATQANINLLMHRDFHVLPVGIGEQACGEFGPGRMLEPQELVQSLRTYFTPHAGFKGKRVLITAGPTHEYFDPVRFLSNPSSGKMGYALAQAASELGAEVTLVSGPSALTAPPAIQVIEVTSALEMYDAVMTHIHTQDFFIANAAVSDYRPAQTASHKVKKSGEAITLELLPNPDILKSVAQLSHRPFCVGFAAETDHHLEHAQAKLKQKNLDLICVNDVSDSSLGFNSEVNALTVLSPDQHWTFEPQPKTLLAKNLMLLIAQLTEKEPAHALLD